MSKYPQTATYWAPATPNEYNEQTFGSPVSLNVRWEEKTELFISRDIGKEQKSHSVVYTKTDVLENGFLYLGTSVSATPRAVDKAFLIRRFDKISSLNGNRYTRKIWL